MELAVDPALGAGITAFRWRGIDVFRPHSGGRHPTDLASFPLVPFCNRIAHGRISYQGHVRILPFAHGDIEPTHALHGVGWISSWLIEKSSSEQAILSLKHDGALWPWEFVSEQRLDLLDNGYSHTLSIINRDEVPMPTGLGFHPYFPRANATFSLGAKGYWETGKDRLPSGYHELEQEADWFAGSGYDDCFTGCSQPISLCWPTHRLSMHCSPNLAFTHVYSPPGEDFFCVEPVSHIPDAVNSELDSEATGLVMLDPGERMEIECRFELRGPD
ncbi:MAG: aldose 1-epimerase [Erythrobacter sp.]